MSHDADTPGYGRLQEKSDAGLVAEWHYWNNKINNATAWGAAVSAADEFKKDAESELRRRRLSIPESE